jgi:hypothetical protein
MYFINKVFWSLQYLQMFPHFMDFQMFYVTFWSRFNVGIGNEVRSRAGAATPGSARLLTGHNYGD